MSQRSATTRPLDEEALRSMHIFSKCPESKRTINSVDFSEDGNLVVTASDDESIHVYSADTAKCEQKTYSKKYGVCLIRFSRDNFGTVFYASKNGWTNSIRYLAFEGNCFLRYFTGHLDQVISLSTSPSNMLLSSSLDETVRLWDHRSTSCQGQIHKSGRVISAFDPQGIVFAVGSDNNTLSLYDIRSYDKSAFSVFNYERPPTTNNFSGKFEWQSLEFSYDGKTILGLTTSNIVLVLCAFTGKVEFEWIEEDENIKVNCVTFTPDAKFVLAGLSSKFVRIWSCTTGHQIACLESGHDVRSLKFNPKMMMFCSASVDLAFWSAVEKPRFI